MALGLSGWATCVAMCPAGPLVPGGTSATQVLEELWPVHDFGEMLAADGDSEPERAKCLYLSIAAAVGLKLNEARR